MFDFADMAFFKRGHYFSCPMKNVKRDDKVHCGDSPTHSLSHSLEYSKNKNNNL